MIATGLTFLFGFLTAILIALLVAPLAMGRARRLARREFEAAIPVSANEIRASFDHVRAEAALTARRREMDALAMREKARGRVFTFGRAEGCDLRATDVEARWPERLSFTATAGGVSRRVETQLVGEHWLPSVLGALGAAVAAGVPLEGVAPAMARVEPTPARMQPVELPSGAWMLRDEFNPSFSTLDAALETLRTARGVRRIAVLGEALDGASNYRGDIEEVGRRAATAADLVVFVGPRPGPARRAALEAGLPEDRFFGFKEVREAGDFLREMLGPGDLALLRGSNQRRFDRIYFRQFGDYACAKTRCSKIALCDVCPELGLELDAGIRRDPRAPWEAVRGFDAPPPGLVRLGTDS